MSPGPRCCPRDPECRGDPGTRGLGEWWPGARENRRADPTRDSRVFWRARSALCDSLRTTLTLSSWTTTEVTEAGSMIDSSTSTRITGIEIPGFLSRKAESHLRVTDGMTFAVAGLLMESTRYTRDSIPLLGDIPLIGAAFRYTRHRRDETELMIFVTPRLVRPMAEGEVPPYPGAMEDNNPNDFELFWLGMDQRGGSRAIEPAGPVGMTR